MVTWSDVTWRDMTWWCDVMWCDAMQRDMTWCYDVMWCDSMRCDVPGINLIFGAFIAKTNAILWKRLDSETKWLWGLPRLDNSFGTSRLGLREVLTLGVSAPCSKRETERPSQDAIAVSLLRTSWVSELTFYDWLAENTCHNSKVVLWGPSVSEVPYSLISEGQCWYFSQLQLGSSHQVFILTDKGCWKKRSGAGKIA